MEVAQILLGWVVSIGTMFVGTILALLLLIFPLALVHYWASKHKEEQ